MSSRAERQRARYAAKRKANICVRCGEKPSLKRAYCATCAHRSASAVRVRHSGVTEAQYSQAWLAQGGACAICHRHQRSLRKALAADHHAASGQFRELLCNACNLAIGYFREHIPTLTEAIAYLTRHHHGMSPTKASSKSIFQAGDAASSAQVVDNIGSVR